ncbi:MAG: GNAT family N-acetyltransferase [Chloroflexota bacterium]
MDVRQATIADAEILSALNADVQKLHADAHPQLFKQPSDQTFPPSAALDVLNDPNAYIYIGKVKGEAVGYIYAEIRTSPENDFRYEMRRVSIHDISIKPDHQKKGYGERLIQSVKMLAQKHDITMVILDVWSFNTNARSFFAEQGFTAFNERMWLHIS